MDFIDKITALLPHVGNVVEWFFVTIVIKYIISKWIAQKTVEIMKKVLVSSQKHAIYWVHYRERAIGRGHKADVPETCRDGLCKTIHPRIEKFARYQSTNREF